MSGPAVFPILKTSYTNEHMLVGERKRGGRGEGTGEERRMGKERGGERRVS